MNDITEALREVAIRKNISKEIVLETLEAALIAAAKKKYGTAKNLIIDIDETVPSVKLYISKLVVEKVSNSKIEINLEDAKLLDPYVEIDDRVEVEISLADFGRTAIQTAKQVMTQRVRELERDQIYETYSELVGTIVTGSVRRMDSGKIIVSLGKTEGIIPPKEKIGNERYHQGDTIRAYILRVSKDTKGPQVVLTRTHPGFLSKLFELEVPEIQQNIVEIKAVSREPGDRAKIAVRSSEPRVDPVGACVGVRGSRVQTVVQELNGEKIDIVHWNEEPAIYVSRAIAPARVQRVIIYETERKMKVVVEKDQLSLAIGKAGQNARLASKLTGWKIDLMTIEEYDEYEGREENEELIDLHGLPSISDEVEELLNNEGIASVQDILNWGDDLFNIEGLNEEIAEKLLSESEDLLNQIEEAYEEDNDDETDGLVDEESPNE